MSIGLPVTTTAMNFASLVKATAMSHDTQKDQVTSCSQSANIPQARSRSALTLSTATCCRQNYIKVFKNNNR